MGNLFDYINWIAVFVGALGYFILGAIWYSKALFAKKWIEYTKVDTKDPNATKGVGLMFGGSLVMMFISSLAIAILAQRLGVTGYWLSGVKLGVLTGSCFGMTGIAINYLYEKKPCGLFLINGVYQLLGNIIAGTIICAWP